MGKHDKDYDTTVARAAGNILAGAGITFKTLHDIGLEGQLNAAAKAAIRGAVKIAKEVTDVVREVAPMEKR